MFAYDAELLKLLKSTPDSIEEVVQTLHSIDRTCVDQDGLKWFNWLYLRITEAVANRTATPGGFNDPAWLAELDVRFAGFYFDALKSWLSQEPASGCWRVLFERRDDTRIARVQFALAGVNAHINHDLCAAIVATCQATLSSPDHGGTHYKDYTALNSTLDAQVDAAKKTLMVRLLGEVLPPVSRLEDTLAAWNVTAAREKAWLNAGHLWLLRTAPSLSGAFLSTVDGFTAVIGKTLLVPVPEW